MPPGKGILAEEKMARTLKAKKEVKEDVCTDRKQDRKVS